MTRPLLFAANWKMHLGPDEARDFARRFRVRYAPDAQREVWGERAGALDELLEIVRRAKTWKDGEARKQMVAIFNLAAGEPDLVSEYRRKLSSTLN